jgi:hypothetical protein
MKDPMSLSRNFVKRLHSLLDEAGVPVSLYEREQAFAKLFVLPANKSRLILQGQVLPEDPTLEAVAAEFEVNLNWLLGREEVPL